MHVNIEVVSIPVSDVDKALEFYRDRLGWRVDADIARGEFRVVQMTPTGDGHVSIAFGSGVPQGPPGSMHHLELVTDDIVATRDEIAGRGVDITEVYHGRAARSCPPRACPAPTPHGPATTRTRRSRTRTAMAGPCRRSPAACPAANLLRRVAEPCPGRRSPGP